MEIRSRHKSTGRGRGYVKTQKKLPINFDLSSLDLMCTYVLSNNRNIKRGHYINLRNVMEMLDMSKYVNDQDKLDRITFIKRGIEGKIVKGLSNPLAIIKYINGGIIDDNIIDMNQFQDLSNNEIDWINETISNTLSSNFIYESAPKLIDLLTAFMTADSRQISDLSQQIQAEIASLNSSFRQCRRDSAMDRVFSLKEDVFRNAIKDTYDEITSNFRYLYTGMQGFNQLIGGGFENTRLYLLLGVTGGGKSLSMLNIAYQIKKYNKNFKPKDPTKIPCVVYLTMENSVTETIQRLFEICVGDDMRNYSPEDIEYKLRTEGELYLTDESPIDIIIKYKPNRSEDTSYLYTLTEDLEDEGYEVICLIQDHIKRLRSVENQPDVRLELGNVANEMKTFAIIKDIPVITDSHLNRDGARIIDNTSGRAKADLTRMLGKSNIGESLLMLDNVDLGIILNSEYDYEGNKYMVFKNIKTRIRTYKDYVCIPCDPNNPIKLMEDLFLPAPLYKDTLMAMGAPLINNTNVQNSGYTNIKQLDEDDEYNVYEYSSRYTSMNQDLNITPPNYIIDIPIVPDEDEEIEYVLYHDDINVQ